MKIKHQAEIDNNGKLILFDREKFLNDIKKFKGRRVYIIVDEDRPTRTHEQLKYYFGVMLPMICEYIELTTGEKITPEEMHEYYIEKGYYGYDVKNILGEEVVIRNRSRKVNTKQFNEIMEKIRREWAERGLVIPEPNQVVFI